MNDNIASCVFFSVPSRTKPCRYTILGCNIVVIVTISAKKSFFSFSVQSLLTLFTATSTPRPWGVSKVALYTYPTLPMQVNHDTVEPPIGDKVNTIEKTSE